MDSDSAVKLKMIRLARRLLRQAKAREERGQNAGAYRRAFGLLIRTLRVAIDGGIPPERMTELDSVMNRFERSDGFDKRDRKDQNRYNSVTPIDKSPHSDIIKLDNPNTDGGPGSGNFGHKGVPGQVGGSAPSNGGNASGSSGGTGNSTGNASSSTGASGKGSNGSGSTGNAAGKGASSSSAAPASSNGGSSNSGSASNSTGATASSVATTSSTGNESNAPIANNAQPSNARSSSQTKREKITKRLVGQTTHDGIEIKSISKHAFDRISGRKISMGRIEKMITTGKVSDGNQPDTKVYDIDGSRMVIDSKTGTVISIMWRNKK